MRSVILSFAATCALSVAASAQAAPATVTSDARLHVLSDSLPAGPSATAQLGRGDGYTYALTQRDRDGGVESHAKWADAFVIRAGTATLRSGGTADGARDSGNGEWRDGVIRGGTEQQLKPGDVVVIPAGVPHQMLVPKGGHVTYLAFKIAANAPPAGK